MTRISYISGIPQGEYADRGQQVRISDYIPFMSMTKGEFRLAILKEQANTLKRFYPEVRAYQQASLMLDNALYNGVHRGVNFIGAIDPGAMNVARAIAQAKNQTAPASRFGLMGRESLVQGIGDPVFNFKDADCRLWAVAETNKFYGKNYSAREWETGQFVKKARRDRYYSNIAICAAKKTLEITLNNDLINVAHHMIYNRLQKDRITLPADVGSKRLFHQLGIEGTANAAALDNTLFSDWVETLVTKKNTLVGGGPIGSENSSFILSPDPDGLWAAYNGDTRGRGDVTGIGFAPAVAIAVIGAITAAITAAAKFAEALKKTNQNALNEAKGFGTLTYSGQKQDWENGGGGNDGKDDDTTTKSDNTLFILGGAALAAYLLTKD